jgi:putative SOS response-associated peptidase YedK
MCGRFTLKTPADRLAEAFGGAASDYPQARYNIVPGQPVAALRAVPETSAREVVALRWGLVPSWTKDPAIGNKMINARAETLAEKPSFRTAFRRRRCLVPADGFYEWQKTKGTKQPFHIARADGAPFAFAGLWERWEGDGTALESCTIVTTEANECLAPIHQRMPVILKRSDYALWLDPKVADRPILEALLRPCPADDLVAWAVSTHVNSPAHDDPACIDPLA